ncbi:flavin reductase (DIM6/NTAB) family NADH-FMN oxidoreductase RutF [Panacagrimonas perspica]|uniref:Flavin reductase (DIM6/NTAB) family NADH-FMN oxidoreductase RutF n=1 Tax=Panacagrimonas perspica TaxID=381431 RepID=A0A4S3K194_9GAMM|nr:flavin reductase family protein [Panacagrimonas perspica]TDU28551.1 flavin reductase (DIM6/NTAB) family NADH-FMN oxidoreductase RutF [Panacagrimonas perspica]THD01494.1 hypothetical protein B1810_19510 [Panacagrimonas perspica]
MGKDIGAVVANDMAQDFRSAMRRLATTVSVITCVNEGERHGITATAVTSVCAEPASLLVCINNATRFYQQLVASSTFCVNMLRTSQVDLSQAFGTRGGGLERFGIGTWAQNEDGVPYLVDAQANVFCTVRNVTHYGTHGIFIGEVSAVLCADEIAPLIYQDGRYARTAEIAA